MRACGILRQQHAELLLLAREIVTLLEGSGWDRDTTRVRLKLSTWTRKFRTHLTLEERLVYPRLAEDQDPLVGKRAMEHRDDMRALLDELSRVGPCRILDQSLEPPYSPTLIQETKRLFAELATNFRLEETELYGPVEVLASGRWVLNQTGGDGGSGDA